MGAKLVGVLLLIAGVVIILFGVAYINSPQYKVMSLVHGVTGGSDPTGNAALVIGWILSFVGFVVLLAGVGKKTNS